MKSFLATLSATLLLFVVACDFNPSSPFSGFDGGQGATLSGRFTQSSAATATPSAYRAQTVLSGFNVNDLEVVVLDEKDNEIGRVEIKDESFTLRGLPESFQVVFEDRDGVRFGDPIPFDAVKPNQEVDIVVAVYGDEVVLIEETRTGIDHDEIEAEGRLENLAVMDSMTGSFDVGVYHVVTMPGQTSIRKGNQSLTLLHLNDGDRVHVRGVTNEDGDVLAYEVKLQEDDEDAVVGDGKVTICHIPPGNPSKKKTLSVGTSAVPAHLAHGDMMGPCS